MSGSRLEAGSLLVAKAFLALTTMVAATSGSVWRLADVQCAPESTSATAAFLRFVATRENHCVMMASEKAPTGALVAQFDKLSRTCSVFEFQSVCRALTSGQSASCAVFYRFPINHRSMNAKLNNVWLGDSVSRLENLVCQADRDTNRLHPVGVAWSSDGAVFDGVSAFAQLNKSDINFTTGLAWLLRIKRQPRQQPYFDFNDCSTLGQAVMYTAHFWEHPTPRQAYLRLGEVTETLLQSHETPVDTLPAGTDDWVNIGFTTTASGDLNDVFFGNSFLPRASIKKLNEPSSPISNMCMLFGMRVGTPSNYMFNGTLQALAMASAYMSEAEIRQFFELFNE